MQPCLIDTDILSLFLRKQPQVTAHCKQYFQKYGCLTFSQITYYEILSGLKHRDADQQLQIFLKFSQQNQILSLTQSSIEISSQIYAELRKKGTPVDDMDLLIAGIAIANDLVLVTHNQKHFGKIEQLTLQDWTN